MYFGLHPKTFNVMDVEEMHVPSIGQLNKCTKSSILYGGRLIQPLSVQDGGTVGRIGDLSSKRLKSCTWMTVNGSRE